MPALLAAMTPLEERTSDNDGALTVKTTTRLWPCPDRNVRMASTDERTVTLSGYAATSCLFISAYVGGIGISRWNWPLMNSASAGRSRIRTGIIVETTRASFCSWTRPNRIYEPSFSTAQPQNHDVSSTIQTVQRTCSLPELRKRDALVIPVVVDLHEDNGLVCSQHRGVVRQVNLQRLGLDQLQVGIDRIVRLPRQRVGQNCAERG